MTDWNEKYDEAVAIVRTDRKSSTSYIQRKLRVGYNHAATLIQKMEDEGVITAPNMIGRREIISKHKQADIQVNFSIQFTDDGETDLNDQAIAAANEMVHGRMVDHDISVLNISNDK